MYLTNETWRNPVWCITHTHFYSYDLCFILIINKFPYDTVDFRSLCFFFSILFFLEDDLNFASEGC